LYMNITILACFLFPLAWYVIFHPSTFYLCVSSPVRSVSWRQQVLGSCFLLQSTSLHLLMFADSCKFIVFFFLFCLFSFSIMPQKFAGLLSWDSLILSSHLSIHLFKFVLSQALVFVTVFLPNLCLLQCWLSSHGLL
jgi:hypothetical protein